MSTNIIFFRCLIHFSPNSTHKLTFCFYINPYHETMTCNLQPEFLCLVSLQSTFPWSCQILAEEEALTLSILNCLEQIMTHLTHVPDCHEQPPDNLGLFIWPHISRSLYSPHILLLLSPPPKATYGILSSAVWTNLRKLFPFISFGMIAIVSLEMLLLLLSV